MADTSQVRLSSPRSDTAAKAVVDQAAGLSSGAIDDALSIAVQMICAEAADRGAAPADVVVGLGKGLGTTLAFAGVRDMDALLDKFVEIVRDYHGKSVTVLGRLSRQGGTA